MPTASGKSWVIAGLIEAITTRELFPRILKLVHTKELIVQNMEKLKILLPDSDTGILSSGLNSHQTNNKIIFGGIATVANRANSIGMIDYVIIDEVHSVSDKETSNYQKTFSVLKTLNPMIRFIGLTATPFRQGKGSIIDGKMWHDFSYNLTSWREFNSLIEQGYLCNLISRLPDNIINTESVSIQKGDFNQSELQKAVLKNDVTTKALKEAIIKGSQRNKWLVFCAGVEHAKTCSETLNALGIKSTVVHSDLSNEERDKAINGFKSGEFKAICNNNILTVGFDCPEIDLIICLRPTMSVVLHVQMLGRGCRVHHSKKYTLVLDFAYNTQRLGCINDPCLPKKKGTKAGETPVKLCPACQVYNHLSARVCIACGAEFPIQKNIKRFASADELIRTEENVPKWVDVIKCSYVPMGSRLRNFVQIWYSCNGIKIREFLLFGEQIKHTDVQKTINWWWNRIKLTENDEKDMPKSAWGAIENMHKIKTPSRIEFVIVKTKPKILKYEFVVNGERKVI